MLHNRLIPSLLTLVFLHTGVHAQGSGTGTPTGSPACTPDWLPTFGGEPGVRGNVHSVTTFNDGTGTALYAGGTFTSAGGVLADRIAKWDGNVWEPLGSGTNGSVNALAVFDDGGGSELYAAGAFFIAGGVPVNRIAKWDGTTWSDVGGGMDAAILDLFVFDDGNGAELYASGTFTAAGGVAANRIARWDGSTWSALGSGLGGTFGSGPLERADSMTVFDDGTGDALFVGGRFDTAGGLPARNIAKWDGTSWSAVGVSPDGTILSLAVYDDGSGEKLFVGGSFNQVGTMLARGIAMWDGSTWGAVGNALLGIVDDLMVFDDGTGEKLLAAGDFGFSGSFTTPNLATWDGSSWSVFGNGINLGSSSNRVRSLATFDDGTGETLYVAGDFHGTGPDEARGIARWDGTNLRGLSRGLSDSVHALEVFDDGSSLALYAAGEFRSVGGVQADYIARWDGSTWSPVGGGMDGVVYDLEVFDDGNGPALYAGGIFVTAGGTSAPRIARWNGSSWSAIGPTIANDVRTLAVFDDGSGPALYAGGIVHAGGPNTQGVARWNGGKSWSPLGTGISGVVEDLIVFDDGSGPALYAAGNFASAGGLPASRIARWDGTSWSPLGLGLLGPQATSAHALAVFDDGNGSALYVGGTFQNAAGATPGTLARWNGTAWTTIGATPDGGVTRLAALDDGSGTALFAAGRFATVDGVSARNLAKWDGASWSPLGSGVNGPEDDGGAEGASPFSFELFDDGDGPALFVGGNFTSAIDSSDSFLAKWGCTIDRYDDFCNGDGGNQMGCTDCPCLNDAPIGTIGGCLNGSSMSARLRASGIPSVTNDTMRFEMTGSNSNSFALLWSGANRAPANAASPCFGLDSGVSAAVFGGHRCVVQSLQRHGSRASDANGDIGVQNAAWGGSGAGLLTPAGFSAGQTRHFQVVYRDGLNSPCLRPFNTSQGISVTLEP